MSLWIKTAEGWRPLLASLAPCPNSNDLHGVFRPSTLEHVRQETAMRATDYTRDVEAYLAGDLPKERVFRILERPIYGAFGEKL